MMRKKKLGQTPAPVVDKEYQARLDKCIPIAIQALRAIANSDVVLGEGEVVAAADVYNVIASQILELMLTNDLLYVEREFIFQLLQQAVTMTKERVLTSLERSYDLARTQVWGKDFNDITFSDIDKILKADDSNKS